MFKSIGAIICLISYSVLQAVYRQVFPLYFPRSAEEESYAAKALPTSIGDEMGEPIITERQIRILENPTTKGEHHTCLLSEHFICTLNPT